MRTFTVPNAPRNRKSSRYFKPDKPTSMFGPLGPLSRNQFRPTLREGRGATRMAYGDSPAPGNASDWRHEHGREDHGYYASSAPLADAPPEDSPELLDQQKPAVLPQIIGDKPYYYETARERLTKMGALNQMGHRAEKEVEESENRAKDWKPVVKVIDDRRLRVCLIGLMNTGKSTLWNKLINMPTNVDYHRNLTKNFDGLTRDPVEILAAVDDMYFTLIDTPGAVKGRLFPETVKILQSSDLCLFITSAESDITADEREVAQYLRSTNIPTVCVVNKIDLAKNYKDDLFAEYEQLGLGRPVGISALQGIGFDDIGMAIRPFYNINIEHRIRADWALEDKATEGDAVALNEVQERNNSEQWIRVAIIGHPNAGKSSLINRLLGFERSRVSEDKFTTRDAIEVPCTYRGKKIKIIDTAGLVEYKDRINDDFVNELNSQTIKAIRYSHICVVCFDASIGHPDRMTLELSQSVIDEGRGLIFCGCKWDGVIDQAAIAEAIDYQIKRRVREVRYCNCVVTSAVEGTNLTLLMDQVLTLYETWNRTFRTNELTRFWRRMTKTIVVPRHVCRVLYVKQVNVRPPTFLLRLNTKSGEDRLRNAHIVLFRNALAEEFEINGVPIRIIQDVKRQVHEWL